MKQNQEMEDILSRGSLKENPFGVPAGYFTSVQEEVMEKISAIPVAGTYSEEEVKAEPATFMTYFKPAFAMAAMFGLIFGIGWGAMKLTETGTGETTSDKTIITENTQGDMTEEEIISILNITIEDLYAAGDDEVETPASTMELDGETIEQYLIDTRLPSSAIALLE